MQKTGAAVLNAMYAGANLDEFVKFQNATFKVIRTEVWMTMFKGLYVFSILGLSCFFALISWYWGCLSNLPG